MQCSTSLTQTWYSCTSQWGVAGVVSVSTSQWEGCACSASQRGGGVWILPCSASQWGGGKWAFFASHWERGSVLPDTNLPALHVLSASGDQRYQGNGDYLLAIKNVLFCLNGAVTYRQLFTTTGVKQAFLLYIFFVLVNMLVTNRYSLFSNV